MSLRDCDCYGPYVLRQRRHAEIMRILRTEGPVAVVSMADRLGVSPATVRRDLVHLDQEGTLTRVHGGALVRPDAEPPFAQVATSNLRAKDAIARRAAERVQDGDVLLLDIGTTTLCLARHLRGRHITVLTSSMAVFEELNRDPAVELVVLGGSYRRNYRSLVGFLTEDALRQVRARRLFLGTSGIRPGGDVMDTTVVEVPVKRAMIAAADEVVLLADAAKFPGSGLARVCGPAELDVVVTDAGSDPRTLATLTTLAENGVEVVTACG